MNNIIIIVVGVHLVVTVALIWDLFSVSKRPNKASWAVFLIIIPFISAYFYQAAMKRRRQHLP